jgi:hypothetical protein
MRTRLGIVIATLILLIPLAASAQDRESWTSTGITGLSIRFDEGNPTMCTWAFRNDSFRTLTALNFRIEDFNAETRVSEHSTDLIPFPLHTGQEAGGWSTFSANANCKSVRLVVTNIQWQ